MISALSRLTLTEPTFHVAHAVQIQPGKGENKSKVEEYISPEDSLIDGRLVQCPRLAKGVQSMILT